MRNQSKVRAFLDGLRAGKYTGVGCYPTFFLMSDGDTLSYEAACENTWLIARATRDGDSSGWAFEAFDVNWEDGDMVCADTGKRIESAYAEPEPMPDAFFDAFIECALWSSTECDEDGNMGSSLDEYYSADDIAPETVAALRKDCEDFWEANYALLQRTEADDEQNGHDFWLTRNGHGAGFWDRGYGEVGEELSKAAKVYGSVDLVVCDGKVCS